MADNNWNVPTPGVQSGDVNVARDAGIFGTTQLKEALSTNGTNGSKKTETPAGWVQPTAYDYTAYGRDSGHEWDSNARVYEWDGEHGDIGPEVPVLEVELFGEPGKRNNRGIDFSTSVFAHFSQ